MIVKCSVDWISCTFTRNDLYPDDILLGRWAYTGKGLHGYSARWKDAITGAVFQSFGPENMGSHLTCSGDVMHNLRIGQPDQQTVKQFIDKDGRFSRIDLAMDIHQSKITPAGMAVAYEQGILKTRARKAVLVEEKSPTGKDRGQTLYIGNRQSDRFLRAYDKNIEQGIVDQDAWLRLELELKNLRARGASGSVIENGLEPTVKGHIRDMFTYENDQYQMAMCGPSVLPDAVGRKSTNTEKWLLETVSHTLAKCINERPEFWDEFLSSVAKHCTIVSQSLDNMNNE